MTWKFTDLFAASFFFCFFTFMSFHYASVKAPAQHRGVASYTQVEKPWYDASFKY